MKQHTLKIFKVSGKNKENSPVYVLQDGKFFRTTFHPEGWSLLPEYGLGTDGKVYRTEHHTMGTGKTPDYEFKKDMMIYRTPNHPDGALDKPEYKIYD
ncbi:MAG: hypothetical protein GY729_02615 [Desulfobacteraceae bacterium]|nr:hypothetical protein [Desulfobacteraceae bacterium]